MKRIPSSARLVAAALAATVLSVLAVCAGAAEPTSPYVTHVAHAVEVPLDKNALAVEGHPLTSVVVTQCNLIVAVYMTMPDGRLLRFDKERQRALRTAHAHGVFGHAQRACRSLM